MSGGSGNEEVCQSKERSLAQQLAAQELVAPAQITARRSMTRDKRKEVCLNLRHSRRVREWDQRPSFLLEDVLRYAFFPKLEVKRRYEF
jgi:hypothetical protein